MLSQLPSPTNDPILKILNILLPVLPLPGIIFEYFLEKFDFKKVDPADIFKKPGPLYVDLCDEQFSNLAIINADLSGSYAHRSKWVECRFIQIKLSENLFSEADFYKITIKRAFFPEGHPPGFKKATLEQTTFLDSDLSGADFSEIQCIADVKFINCKLENCNFSHADLSKVEIKNCRLAGAIFTKTNLLMTTFAKTDITKTSLNQFPSEFLSQLLVNENAYTLLVSLLQNYIKNRASWFERTFKTFQEIKCKQIDGLLSGEQKLTKELERAGKLIDPRSAYQNLYPRVNALSRLSPSDTDLISLLNFLGTFSNHSVWTKENPAEKNEQSPFI